MTPSVVLSRPSPCNVPQGYASVAGLPAALLGCHFEHPAGCNCVYSVRLAQKYIDHAHHYALVTPENIDYRGRDDGCDPSRFRAS